MDKNSFLNAFSRNSVDHQLPDGQVVTLYGLTAGQRERLYTVTKENPAKQHMALVAMALDFVADDDLAFVAKIPGEEIEAMAKKVEDISFPEDLEKN